MRSSKQEILQSFGFVLVLFELFLPLESRAWTLRGHEIICENAIFVLKNKELKDFLMGRELAIAHLCNLPDTQWKMAKGKVRVRGDASHYIFADVLAPTVNGVDQVPLVFSEFLLKFVKKHPKVQEEDHRIYATGSNWWRAEQFFNKAVSYKERLESSKKPATLAERFDEDLPYNRAVYQWMMQLGLLGHYVGDNAQPFHVTGDYDGYDRGHGGIHLYYEHDTVKFLSESLSSAVLKRAREIRGSEKWIKEGSVLERMKELAKLAYSHKDAVLAFDPVIEPSQKEKSGKSPAAPALRKDLSRFAKKVEPMIIEEMAFATALLAQFWEEIYLLSGSPEVQLYLGYQFPHQVPYLEPDYYPDSLNSK